MTRNLEAIALGAARECLRQGVDERGLINLLSAHYQACHWHTEKPTEQTIKALAWTVDPNVNAHGYRRTPVAFANLSTGVDPIDVPMAMERLVENMDLHDDPNQVVKAFLDIHPFLDGNGRVAWLLFNWLSGRLHEPLPLPEFYPAGAA